ARTEIGLARAIDQHHLDGRNLVEGEDGIARPVSRKDARVVEPHLLLQRPAQGLDDPAFNLVGDAVGTYDVAAVVGSDRADDAYPPVARGYLDLHRNGREGRQVLIAGECDAAAAIALLLKAVPAEAF